MERSTPYSVASVACGRQPQPQVHQRDEQPIGEHQSLLGTGSGGPPAGSTPPFVQRRLSRGLPLGGELFEQLA
ncbi:hypothetical protein [Streptomyces sp. NBC_01615]|uniref:hypothetical protein n=1 Tax=Streptomyces sp. NBC_01615 TaxID=2975898 RepID=UPI003863CD7A